MEATTTATPTTYTANTGEARKLHTYATYHTTARLVALTNGVYAPTPTLSEVAELWVTYTSSAEYEPPTLAGFAKWILEEGCEVGW